MMVATALLATAALYAASFFALTALARNDKYDIEDDWRNLTHREPSGELDGFDYLVCAVMALLGPVGFLCAYSVSAVWFGGWRRFGKNRRRRS